MGDRTPPGVPTRGKKSTTDHPPIHPTSVATRESIGDDAFKVDELVLRRFLATLSPDALWKTLKINFDAGGEEYHHRRVPARTRLARIPILRGKRDHPAGICRRERNCQSKRSRSMRRRRSRQPGTRKRQTDPADGGTRTWHQEHPA